jgi:ABC-type uncharacterized transport system YnjBCD ATPase subunit
LTETAPVIAVKNLIKQFGRFAALRGVTAQFAGGKLYAILGDNGAGKTTLLRTLAGLNHPSAGEITILGATCFKDICHQVGYMAHPSLLYDEMTGMENLAYFARLYGIKDDNRRAEVIRAVGLDPKLMRPVGQYSQGMRQRMSLARACSTIPRFSCSTSPFRTSISLPLEPWFACWPDCAIKGRLFSLSPTRRRCSWRSRRVRLDGGRQDRRIALVAQTAGDWRMIPTYDSDPNGTAVQVSAKKAPNRGYPKIVRGITRATLLKDLRLEWRSKDAINSMLFFSCWWSSSSASPLTRPPKNRARSPEASSGSHFCLPPSSLSTRRGRANCAIRCWTPTASRPRRQFTLPRQGARQFYLRHRARSAHDAAVHRVSTTCARWARCGNCRLWRRLGTWALVVNGTFFAAMSIRTRSREIMLPLLLFPISIPAILAMVQATTAILTANIQRPFLDRVACNLRSGVYYELFAVVRNSTERRS